MDLRWSSPLFRGNFIEFTLVFFAKNHVFLTGFKLEAQKIRGTQHFRKKVAFLAFFAVFDVFPT
jgi:hypothetical protein